MSTVAFDTLKLAQRLEAAGFPSTQAQDMASAISDTIVITRDELDLRPAQIRPLVTAPYPSFSRSLGGVLALQAAVILVGFAVLLWLLQ